MVQTIRQLIKRPNDPPVRFTLMALCLAARRPSGNVFNSFSTLISNVVIQNYVLKEDSKVWCEFLFFFRNVYGLTKRGSNMS